MTRDEAIRRVQRAFQEDPGSMTPEQAQAFEGMRGAFGVDTSPAPTGGATPEVGEEDLSRSDILMEELTGRLMGQGDVVRSGADRIGEAFESAREDIEAGAEAVETGVGARFDRLRAETQDMSELRQRAFDESRQGFATNNAMLKELRKESDKKVKELERMEQEALAQNQHQTAQQLSQLRLQELQFEQQAEQQIFDNMVQSIGVGLQIQAGERDLQRLNIEQDRLRQDEVRIQSEKRMFMANIASQYGIDMEEGETIDSLVTKVSERDLTEREAMELELLAAQIETQETQNSRLRQEINLAQQAAAAEQQGQSVFGFTNLEREREFTRRAVEYKSQMLNEIRRAETAGEEIDEAEMLSNQVDLLATEFASDVPGGMEEARDAAMRAMGYGEYGAEEIDSALGLSDFPGTGTVSPDYIPPMELGAHFVPALKDTAGSFIGTPLIAGRDFSSKVFEFGYGALRGPRN